MLGVLAVVFAAMAEQMSGHPRPVSLPQAVVLGVVLTVAGTLQVRFHFQDEVDASDLFEVALAPALLVLGPVAVVLTAVTAKALSQALLRVSPVKAGFNVAQWACATALGAFVLGVFGDSRPADRPGQLLALGAALLAVAAVNHAAVAGVLRLVRAAPATNGAAADIRSRRLLELGALAANLCFGLLLATAYAHEPIILVIALLPLIALHQGERVAAAAAADRSRLVELRAASRVLLLGGDPREAIPEFLERVRGGLGAAAADLVMLTPTGRSVHRAEGGSTYRTWLEDASDETLAASLLRLERAALVPPDAPPVQLAEQLHAAGRRNLLAAPLDGGGRRVGVLCVFDRTGLRGFGESLRQTLDALAAELAAALARSDLLATAEAERARFGALVRGGSDVVLVLDPDSTIAYASPAARKVLDREPASLVGERLADIVHAEDADQLFAWVRRTARTTGAVQPLEFRLPSADGGLRHVEALSRNLLRDPVVGGVVLNARDVSERKRAQTVMARQAVILERIAADAPLPETQRQILGILEEFLLDARGTLRFRDKELVHRVASPNTGFDEDAAELDRLLQHENGPLDLAESRATPVVFDVEDSDLLPESSRTELRQRNVASCWVWPLVRHQQQTVEGSITLLFSECRVPRTADRDLLGLAAHLAANAADRSRSRRQLAYQASHDALTGLPNRAVVRDRISQALARLDRSSAALALVFVDLDGFKIINDSLGHRTGDQLLRELGQRLLGLIRPGDTVARLGGDEFVLLCEDLPDAALAVTIAERVLAELSESVELDGHELFVTASLGIALATDGKQDPDLLLENADVAMYRAKARGGNQYEIFDAAMRSAATRRLATHTALRQAVDRGELRVHYQPTIDLINGRVVGVEALVRWQHPTRGLLAPAQFISLAEETGLIVPLGAQVLRESCRQVVQWRKLFPDAAPLKLAVNLSPRQIASGGVVALVRAALSDAGLDASSLSLEITETTLMEDLPGTTRVLGDLKDVGVKLTIDDFGTGYSSLSYLRNLPVDSLKLDQSFVRHVESGPDRAIAEMVINLAHTLGLETVAEGIETSEQLKTLCVLGCDVGQGYHLGRPVPSDEIEISDREVEVPERELRSPGR